MGCSEQDKKGGIGTVTTHLRDTIGYLGDQEGCQLPCILSNPHQVLSSRRGAPDPISSTLCTLLQAHTGSPASPEGR